MSCPNNQNPLVLDISMGRLPEGFCPENLQDLADAIAARLIIAPSEASLNISGGSTEPSGNIGPWFKNCEQLFVYNDELAKYVPIEKGGFNGFQVFDANGTFTVPDNIFKLFIEGWGAGAGGHDSSGGSSSSGGGAGAYGRIIKDVVPGQSVPLTVGVGGINGTPGANGGDTIVLGMNCGGGKASAAPGDQGIGGTTTGAGFAISGGPGEATSAATGGEGGSSPQGGSGGQPGPVAAGRTAIAPGGAGCGSTVAIHVTGSPGANGRVVVWY